MLKRFAKPSLLRTSELSGLDDQIKFFATEAAKPENVAHADKFEAAAQRAALEKMEIERQRGLPPIPTIAANASAVELKRARRQSATRRGKLVYSARLGDDTVALPDVLLRSAMFGIGDGDLEDHARPVSRQIVTYGDASITYIGEPCDQYDLRVYAAALDLYATQPFAAADGYGGWLTHTAREMLASMGLPYSTSSHAALRRSLLRQSEGQLRIRVGGDDLPVPRLLEVGFREPLNTGAVSDPARLRASDLISIRITDAAAHLFAPNRWTAIAKGLLSQRGYGLAKWIAMFYCTHRAPYPISLDDLRNLSRSDAQPDKFRDQLLDALTKLSGVRKATRAVRVKGSQVVAPAAAPAVATEPAPLPVIAVDESARIEDYAITPDGQLLVWMHAWSSKLPGQRAPKDWVAQALERARSYRRFSTKPQATAAQAEAPAQQATLDLALEEDETPF